MNKLQQDINDQIALIRDEIKSDLRELVGPNALILKQIDTAPLHDLVLLSQELCRIYTLL